MKKLFTLTFAAILFAIFLIVPTKSQAAIPGVVQTNAAGLAKELAGCKIALGSGIKVFESTCSESGEYSLEKWVGGSGETESAMVSVTNLIAATVSNPPASAGYYVADLMQNTGLAPQAYAQGVGFSALSPILPIWKAFRNMTYFLFVIIFVVIGFAIMFRAQLNPQTVVSIQSALPNLVITLLLITFSYAIAGLVVDAMYISIYLIISMFKLTNLTITTPLEKIAFQDGIIANMFGLISGIGVNTATSIGETIQNVMSVPVLSQASGLVGGIFGFLIITVAIIIAMFRTWFALIGAYTQIIVAVVTAPFQIMLNALPGSNAFENWLKNLIANLAVFPAVIAMLFAVYLFAWNNSWEAGFKAPQIANGLAGPANGLISLGIVMLMPEVVKIVKGALQVKDSELGQVAGTNFWSGNVLGNGLAAGGRTVVGIGVSAASQTAANNLSNTVRDKGWNPLNWRKGGGVQTNTQEVGTPAANRSNNRELPSGNDR